jgi:hypothetical protein
MKIKIFKKDNPIESIELELKKDTEKYPAENPPKFPHK